MMAKNDNVSRSATERPAKDDLHIWRSKFFDQSARCEARLRRTFATLNPKVSIPHQFKSVALAVKQTGEILPVGEKLMDAIDELLPLIELRAYLAHSAMRLIVIDGDEHVAFAHAGGDQEFGQKVMLLNTEQR